MTRIRFGAGSLCSSVVGSRRLFSRPWLSPWLRLASGWRRSFALTGFPHSSHARFVTLLFSLLSTSSVGIVYPPHPHFRWSVSRKHCSWVARVLAFRVTSETTGIAVLLQALQRLCSGILRGPSPHTAWRRFSSSRFSVRRPFLGGQSQPSPVPKVGTLPSPLPVESVKLSEGREVP